MAFPLAWRLSLQCLDDGGGLALAVVACTLVVTLALRGSSRLAVASTDCGTRLWAAIEAGMAWQAGPRAQSSRVKA